MHISERITFTHVHTQIYKSLEFRRSHNSTTLHRDTLSPYRQVYLMDLCLVLVAGVAVGDPDSSSHVATMLDSVRFANSEAAPSLVTSDMIFESVPLAGELLFFFLKRYRC